MCVWPQQLKLNRLRLLKLERNVERENKRVLNVLRHVRMAAAVIEDKAANELAIDARVLLGLLHLHYLYHMQIGINVVGRFANAQNLKNERFVV